MINEYAVIIRPAGDEVRQVQCTLENLQNLVGGYIETVIVRINRMPYVMVIDEEGKLKGKQYNPQASSLYKLDRIVGTAVIVKAGNDDLIGLTREEAYEISSVLTAELIANLLLRDRRN